MSEFTVSVFCRVCFSTDAPLLQLFDLSVVVYPLWDDPHCSRQLRLFGQGVVALVGRLDAAVRWGVCGRLD